MQFEDRCFDLGNAIGIFLNLVVQLLDLGRHVIPQLLQTLSEIVAQVGICNLADQGILLGLIRADQALVYVERALVYPVAESGDGVWAQAEEAVATLQGLVTGTRAGRDAFLDVAAAPVRRDEVACGRHVPNSGIAVLEHGHPSAIVEPLQMKRAHVDGVEGVRRVALWHVAPGVASATDRDVPGRCD